MDINVCGNCGRNSDQDETFKHCSRCKIVVYCCRACQVQHWKNGHKQDCRAASEREEYVVKKQNKTVAAAEDPSNLFKPSKASDKPVLSSSGTGAPEELLLQVTTRVDEPGTPLSFGAPDDDCTICLDTLENPIRLHCGHWYCKECIERLRQSTTAQDSCPVCREPLPPGAEKAV